MRPDPDEARFSRCLGQGGRAQGSGGGRGLRGSLRPCAPGPQHPGSGSTCPVVLTLGAVPWRWVSERVALEHSLCPLPPRVLAECALHARESLALNYWSCVMPGAPEKWLCPRRWGFRASYSNKVCLCEAELVRKVLLC